MAHHADISSLKSLLRIHRARQWLKVEFSIPNFIAKPFEIWQSNISMKFDVNIIQDEDGIYIAECPAIPGCISQGTTEQEAEKNIQQAIKKCLEVRAEKGMPLTIPVHQVEVIV